MWPVNLLREWYRHSVSSIDHMIQSILDNDVPDVLPELLQKGELDESEGDLLGPDFKYHLRISLQADDQKEIGDLREERNKALCMLKYLEEEQYDAAVGCLNAEIASLETVPLRVDSFRHGMSSERRERLRRIELSQRKLALVRVKAFRDTLILWQKHMVMTAV